MIERKEKGWRGRRSEGEGKEGDEEEGRLMERKGG